MLLKHIPYDDFANESERKATEFIIQSLKNHQNCGNWIVISNISISTDIPGKLPPELDLILIGTKGLFVIEIKHWDINYINLADNQRIIKKEAIKLNSKVKIITGKIRKTIYGNKVGFIKGKFLLTRGLREKFTVPQGRKEIEGVPFFGLTEWQEMLELNNNLNLNEKEINALCDILVPDALPPRPRTFENFINLELISKKEETFRKLFRGLRKPGREKVILNIYDLSAIDDKNPYKVAEREFKVLQELQKLDSLPRIMDSFYEAGSYPGEIYFFSYVDPDAPSLIKRAKDPKWTLEERIAFAQLCFEALKGFHDNPSKAVIHRNLTPDTIKVQSNNRPLFTQLQFARITGSSTISGAVAPEFKGIEDFVAPEVIASGFSVCTKESDIFSLCASLLIIFQDHKDDKAKQAIEILEKGKTPERLKRASLEELIKLFENTGESPVIKTDDIDVDYWDKNTIKELNGFYYKVLLRLGEGRVGSTFKVMQIDNETGEELSGPYVAKVIKDKNTAEQSIKAYNRVRPQTAISPYLANVFGTRSKWKENEITILLIWIDGDPLNDWIGTLPLYLDEIEVKNHELFILKWIKNLCEGLSELHKVNLVHGDISPNNIIINKDKITLTDFDLTVKTGIMPFGGNPLYCSSGVDRRRPVSPSDDIFALAASIFHTIFDHSPFKFNGILDKDRGLNWKDQDKNKYSKLFLFLDKATHPEPDKRFTSSIDTLEFVNSLLEKASHVTIPITEEKTEDPVHIPEKIPERNDEIDVKSIEIKYLKEPSGQLYNVFEKNKINEVGKILSLEEEDFLKDKHKTSEKKEPQVSLTSPSTKIKVIPVTPEEEKFFLLKPEMFLIPEGFFYMGSEKGLKNEKPVHKVRLNSFFMSRNLVTNEMYCQFLNSQGNQKESGSEWIKLSKAPYCGIEEETVSGNFSVKPGYEKIPVIYVNWYGAIAYCNWLSETESLEPSYGPPDKRGKNPSLWLKKNGYRLPTEAEWEYACRTGTENTYYWGDNINDDYLWYKNNSDNKPQPVSQKKPNNYGLYDMAGNVFEWCNDWFNDYSEEEQINPAGPETGSYKVGRGGSYTSKEQACRSTIRSGTNPKLHIKDTGFRLVRSNF